MEQEDRIRLSFVAEAVLVVARAVELEDYGHWEVLMDSVVDLCERLNDMKPSYSRVTTEE